MGTKQGNNSGDIDLFADIIDGIGMIIYELIKALIFLLGKLGEYLYGKINFKLTGKLPIKTIKLKQLKCRKFAGSFSVHGWSINHKKAFYFNELDTTKHTGVIGSTGSGKSVCLNNLQRYSLMRDMPIIFFDPKASIGSIKEFRAICKCFGKKAYVFSDVIPDGDFFNPLLEGTLDDISDRIISSLEWSEPFYKNECIEALDQVLHELQKLGVIRTLNNILKFLKKHPNQKNIKSLINQLAKLNNSSFGKLLNNESPETLTYAKVRVERSCLYIGISSMGLSSSGNILNKMFFGGLLTHCKEVFNGQIKGIEDPEEKPISVFFDELSSIIHEGFIDLQNKCRSAGVQLTFATQCPSDIDRISPTLTTQIFENTNNLFIFNQIVPVHTEFFSRTIGTITTAKKTHVIEDDRQQSKGSSRDVEEFIVHGNILRQLSVGQCVVLQRTPKRVDLLNVEFVRASLPITSEEKIKADSVLEAGGN